MKEKLNQWEITLAIMKKWINDSHFAENRHTAKFQITDTPPQVWVFTFPSVDGNSKLASTIMK